MTIRKFTLLVWIGMVVLFFGCSSFSQSRAPETSLAASPAAPAPENPADIEAKAQATARLHEMIKSAGAYTTEEIMPLYDQLDAVDIEFMLGTWKGGKFDGGKSPDPINWYGKRFNSANDAEPLLARKPDGTVYSFNKWGMAQVREIKFRGKVSASLIYDNKPIMDYFRKIDDNTLIGLGEMKGKITFFFYLTRDNTLAKE